MGDKMDLRKKRTRRMLRTALLELVEEKGLERVTVSELTERAEINRGTFYLHYRDVPDFMEQLKHEVFDGLADALSMLNPLEIRHYGEKDEAYPASIEVLRYIAKHADFFRVILGPNGDASFPLRIKEFMIGRLYNHVLEQLPRTAGEMPRDYLLAFMTSANIGMLTHWVQSGMTMSVDELALMLTRILYRGPIAVLSMTK